MNISQEMEYLNNLLTLKKKELLEFRDYVNRRKIEIDYLEQIIFTLKRKTED